MQMSLDKADKILGFAIKIGVAVSAIILLPTAFNEVTWLYKGKKAECTRLKSEYQQLIVSSSGLNTRAFSPGDGTAINQVFLGAVLSSSTQSPNAKLLQASIYGCGTEQFPLQTTSW